MVIFFMASPAASSAYLTVSEPFPLEVRALAIALFYAVGTGIGGVVGPALFGALIDTGSRDSVFGGYLFGSALMIAAAVHRLATSTYMRLAALRAPVQPTRSPCMSSRLARATVAENCDCKCSSAHLADSGVDGRLS